MPDNYRAPESSHRFVLDLVRRADRERFLAALFAPEPARRDLLAVLAFDHELARTRHVTSEPLLAHIRLQWWREAAAEAAGVNMPRAQPIVEAVSEMVRRNKITIETIVALIDAREEEVEGALDVVRTGHALADLEMRVLGVADDASHRAAQAVATAWLMGEGPERADVLADARAQRNEIDPRALPILLPALALDGLKRAPWRTPLVYWWAARRGRY